MANNKLFIPTFISDDKFNPARVQPRVFYYNGLIEAPDYKFYTWDTATGTSATMYTLNKIPYVDHYNVVSGSFPNTESDSLLFFNEISSYGVVPSKTLYSEYWNTYIELLYNPRTRLINAEAIIPLADYFELELNDIVEWRANYYHLRAINEYSFTTGECKLQLLGPIIDDALDINVLECYSYILYADSTRGTTFNWEDCDGTRTGISVAPGASFSIECARAGSITANQRGAIWTEFAPCGSYTTTTTTAAPTTTTTTTTSTTTTTTTTAPVQCVINFGASMAPCFGGSLDDYMEGFVYLNLAVEVDTDFTIRVEYIPGTPFGDCNTTIPNTIDLTVTVLAGNFSGVLTCPDAPFIDFGGATICSSELIDSPFPEC